MSERKVDLTEQAWKMQLGGAWLAGRSLERESVVAWLRGFPTLGITFADRIERGEHLRDDDE